jgi:hypothetical protein
VGEAMSDDQKPLRRYDEFLTEQQVCERFRLFVGQRELRKARQNGDIAFMPGKRGTPLYHPDDLAAYLHRKEIKAVSSRRGPANATGSSGMTEEAARLLEDRFERKFLKKRKDA